MKKHYLYVKRLNISLRYVNEEILSRLSIANSSSKSLRRNENNFNVLSRSYIYMTLTKVSSINFKNIINFLTKIN